MAFIQCGFYSDILKRLVNIHVILPEDSEEVPEGGFPVLYLLHGLSDDHSAWSRNTGVERYAMEKGIAVVMADAQRSFYTDMKNGSAYYTFFTEELIQKSEMFFHISRDRESRYIAGLSMGGYGALKLAFRSGYFSAAGSFSGAVDISTVRGRLESYSDFTDDYRLIFGDGPEDKEDLFYLCEQEDFDISIRIYHSCGTEDFLYKDNLKLKASLENLKGLNYSYSEGPGDHLWTYWDKEIELFIKWL